MFRALLSLIIRSILTAITASGFIHVFAVGFCHDSSRQRHTWIKLEAVITVKMLLMMSDNIAWNV